MPFEFELYIDDDGKKAIYISANDGASGAEYAYETVDDIGNIIAEYLTNYYPDVVADPNSQAAN